MKQEIIQKLDSIPDGVPFDSETLGIEQEQAYPILQELAAAGEIRRMTDDVYYKPITSSGLGELPPDWEQSIVFFEKKLNAHISGPFGYNMIGLTEQCATTLTLAGPNPFEDFEINGCRTIYMPSRIGCAEAEYCIAAIIFDALENIHEIPGHLAKEVLCSIKDLIKRRPALRPILTELSQRYPDEIKNVLAQM